MTQQATKTTVAITGMGIVSSLGIGVPTFKQALFTGHSQFTRSSNYSMLSFPVLGAFVNTHELSQALSRIAFDANHQWSKIKTAVQKSPLPIQAATVAAIEAWIQARCQQTPLDLGRTGIIVGVQNAASNYQYGLYEAFKQEPAYLSPTYGLHFMDTDHVGILSAALGISGEGFTVGGASATGNVALLRGHELIRNGTLDACLVVGGLADLSPLELQGFHNLGALGGHRFADKPMKACRPFDAAHEGFIYGQAAACILLESVSSARKRHIPILAGFLGGRSCLDANYLSNPSILGEARVMQEALAITGISVKQIDYVNAHGTSAPLGDEIELQAIENVFGDHCQQLYVNSTKSMTGHCLWSAGVVEAIATIIQMSEELIHPTLNLDNPLPARCQLVRNTYLKHPAHFALSNSFGFGGINTAIVLSSPANL